MCPVFFWTQTLLVHMHFINCRHKKEFDSLDLWYFLSVEIKIEHTQNLTAVKALALKNGKF